MKNSTLDSIDDESLPILVRGISAKDIKKIKQDQIKTITRFIKAANNISFSLSPTQVSIKSYILYF